MIALNWSKAELTAFLGPPMDEFCSVGFVDGFPTENSTLVYALGGCTLNCYFSYQQLVSVELIDDFPMEPRIGGGD